MNGAIVENTSLKGCGITFRECLLCKLFEANSLGGLPLPQSDT